ncbi:MAG TPA: histidine kinase, partial [Candidatus Limnocylindrales bacterium]|nr:histidine kinase [Candidatus Limnocylindrales bacterium]
MAVLRFLRAHIDTVTALLLAVAYLAEDYLAAGSPAGQSFVATLEVDETVAIATAVAFLLSLAVRTRWPLVPLALAFAALTLAGRTQLEASYVLLAGLILAIYSVGAWAGGRASQLGALGVGGLAGLTVLREGGETLVPRDVALPVLLIVGAWLVGLAARSVRAGRGDERVVGDVDWGSASSVPDSAGRDEIVRQIRDVVERSMSAVILQARTARASLDREPARTQRALAIIEAAGTEALEETQRLAGL